jgi:hypothetical protein
MTRAKPLAIAAGIGVLLTVALTGAAYLLHYAGMETAARALLWPNTLLQSLIPCVDVGMPSHRMCEGTPLNVVAYGASFPLSIIVYGLIAYALIRHRIAGGG